MAKQVRDVKGEDKKPDEKIEVIGGNTHIISVQLLNSINQNLVSVVGLLKEVLNKMEKNG